LVTRDYNYFDAQEVPAMTKRLTPGAALLFLSLSVATLLFAQGAPPPGSQSKAPITGEDRDRLLAAGKKLFVERCAKCHDERGDKPLKTGLPLSQRGLSDEEIASTVSGRLKDAPGEEKRAVALYISSFMKRK
jgi:mono/diheme cytochrome c family protein